MKTDFTNEIKKWLLDHKLGPTKVARKMNISHTAVSLWVHGKCKSRNIDRFFRERGMPENLIQREEVL